MKHLFAILAVCLFVLQARGADAVDLVAFGDWGAGSLQQREVSNSLVAYLAQAGVTPQAAILLGDNFYGAMPGGTKDQRWQTEFEGMYPADKLPFPFYVALGNHEYEGNPSKAQIEMDYASENPGSRWKLPSKWYRVEFPQENPLVSLLVIDTDFNNLGEKIAATQQDWLEAELTRPRRGKWTMIAAHHPIFSNGQHADNTPLLSTFAPLIFRHQIDFYLCGHDHDLQHLQIPQWPTSFLIAGGGGAAVRPMVRDDRGPFSRGIPGFAHLHFTPTTAEVKFVSPQGGVVHSMKRTAAGEVSVEFTTGCEKPPPPPSPTPKPSPPQPAVDSRQY